MPAFTHLCEKVNISLFDDTITLYPKKNGRTSMHQVDFWGMTLMQEVDCYYVEVTNFTKEQAQSILYTRTSSLGIKRFIHRDDSDHERYHQDDFDRDTIHMHAQFFKPIDEKKFSEILLAFARRNIISDEESNRCLQAYRQANYTQTTETNFQEQLSLLHIKASEMEDKARHNPQYVQAAQCARELHTALVDAWEGYLHDKSRQGFAHFKSACSDAIAAARPELEKHRGYNHIIANLILFIVTLGVGYLTMAAVRKNPCPFFRETDSLTKINTVQERLNAIAAPGA